MPILLPEAPPDLFIFASWHYSRAYRKAYLADEVWAKLRERHTLAELKEQLEATGKEHNPVHVTVREIFDLPKYEDHSPFINPTPPFVAETLKDFLKFYSKPRPGIFDEKKVVPANKVEEQPPTDKLDWKIEEKADSSNAVPTNDNHLESNETVAESAHPGAPSPEFNPPKRGRGRPKKVVQV